MAFCSNCGKQLVDGAKFCSGCGAPVGRPHAEENARRKTVYEGELHKCPSCGKVLGAFITTCPVCGYEIRNANASNALKEFSEKLSAISSNNQKISLIQSFPIPNTKEDIYDFLILAVGNLNALTQGGSIQSKEAAKEQMDIAAAWYGKLYQCHQKAALLFKDDVEFERVQDLYIEASSSYKMATSKWREEIARANEKEEMRQWRQKRILEKQLSRINYQVPQVVGTQEWKNKWIAWFLCLFLGFWGVHKFYEGKNGEGILYLFTFGLFGIGWLADIFILLLKPNPYMVIKKR